MWSRGLCTEVQHSLIDPEDDCCGDGDSGHECVGAAVVSGVDASPVFEPSEHDLDFVALLIENGVVWNMDFAV
jgi:hypothetical protein